MAILNVVTSQVGLVGVDPQIIYIETSDIYADVTAYAYLNSAKEMGYAFSNNQMALVTTTDSGIMFLEVSVDTSGNVSLLPSINPGTVITPTIANHIATYLDTAGTLTEDPTVALTNFAIQAIDGNIYAGNSAGCTNHSFVSFSPTASRGSLRLVAANNAGDTVVSISNASHGQGTLLTIPDGGQAFSNFIISNSTAGQFISTGSLVLSLGNLIVDQGFIQASNNQVRAGGAGGCSDNQFISFSLTDAKGQLRYLCADNSGDYLIKVTNASHNQNTTITIPDGAQTASNFIISNSNVTQHISTGSLQLDAGSLFIGLTTGGGVNGINIYSPTASSGYLQFITGNNAGNYAVTITNRSHTQNTIHYIPNATGGSTDFVITDPTASQVINSGDFQVAHGDIIVGDSTSSSSNTFISYSNNASSGSLRLKSNNNAGNFITTITQSPQGLASTYSIPNGGQSASNFIISDSAGTQSINTGNLSIASPGDMTVVDGNYFVGNAAGCSRNGYFSYSMAALKGKLVFAARNNIGDFLVRFSNEAHAQDSEYLVPDSGVASSSFIVSNFPTIQEITTGSLRVNAGDVSVGNAGGSGGFRHLRSYAPAAAGGELTLVCTSNLGDHIIYITNNAMGQATTFRLPDPGVANVEFVVNSAISPVRPSNVIYKTFFTEITHTALAAGGFVTLQPSAATGVWAVLDITINDSSTNFSGGGGDRNIAIESYTGAAPAVVYSIIPALTLAAIPNALWGSINVPAPVGFDYITQWGGGDSLVAKYDGGTTDYTAGLLKVSVTLVQIA